MWGDQRVTRLARTSSVRRPWLTSADPGGAAGCGAIGQGCQQPVARVAVQVQTAKLGSSQATQS